MGERPYLGSDGGAPPSSLWVSGSSGSRQEPGRPRCGTARYQDWTAGGPGRTTESLDRDKRTHEEHVEVFMGACRTLPLPCLF